MWQEDRVAKTSGRPTLTSIVGETVAEVSPAKRHGLGRGGPALLKQVPLFANLSARHLKKLASRCEVVRYPVNRTVVRQEARGDSFFVIADGEAAVKKGTRTIGKLGPGDFFGEMALLAPGPRMATVKAESDVEAVMIHADAFQSFLLEHPAVAVSMMKQLVIRLREVEQRIDAWMA